MFWRRAASQVALVLVLGCPGVAGAADVETSVRALADELAWAISSRDADAAAQRVRADSHVAYVSDGTVIRGSEYRDTLARFYAGLRQLTFEWERLEVTAVGDTAAVVTGWARISSVDAAGATTDGRAVFTLVCAEAGSKWELVAAHKTTLK